MVRTTKVEKTTASAAAPVAEKKTKKVKTPEVVAAPVAAPAQVEEVIAPESSVTVKLTEFGAKLQQLISLFVAVKNDYKTLEKTVSRELKTAQKSSRRKKSNGNRQPSGFVKPTRISDELAKFLGKTIGTEMARTEVSREINQYIRNNKLQDAKNGRKINPDNKLSVLLNINSKDEELTYFNLQRYMKHHFIKAPASTA